MRGRWLTMGLGLVVGWGHAQPAWAHFRDYLVNQMYYTTKQGEFEIEVFNDLNLSEFDHDDSYDSKHQIEFEYGLTDHLQIAYYEVYTWDRAKDWERDMFKIETKLRLAEAGQWPVDMAVYAEYKNPNGSRERRSDVVEPKLILSKDFGPWNVIGNFIAEKTINTHSDWEFEYTAGVSYAVAPLTRLGLELKESLGDADAFGIHRKDHTVYLIPGVYTNLTDHVRLLAGVGFGLTRASDDVQLKSILEIEF